MPDPQTNPDAERAVLGACLNSPAAMATAVKVVRPEDFYVPAHETIWDAMLSLHDSGQSVDEHTLPAALKRSGDLQRVGGLLVIADLIGAGINPAAIREHARIVAETGVLRRMTMAGQRVTQLASDGAISPRELAALALAEIEAAYRPTTDERATRVSDFIDDVIDDLEQRDQPSGLEWPYRTTRRCLNPLTPGQLILVAARPGAGKSVMCVDLARDVAIRQGKSVILWSLEMSREEILKRLLAAESRVHLSRIQARDLTAEDWDRIAKATVRIREADLHIVDDPTATVSDIRAAIKTHQPDLLVLDYVQLGTMNPKVERRQGLEEFTRGLKLTAKAAGIPVVTAAQLGRGPEMRVDHTPLLSDLRESGSLENDADTVVLLYRPDYYEAESPRAGELDLIVAKQRNGPTDTIALVHQLHYSRIVDAAA